MGSWVRISYLPTFPRGGVGRGPRPWPTPPPGGNGGKNFFFDFRNQDPEKPGLRCTCKKKILPPFLSGGGSSQGKVTHFSYVQNIRGLLVYTFYKNCICSYTLTRFDCFLYIFTYFYYRGSIIMPNLCKFTIGSIHKFKIIFYNRGHS